MAVINSTSANSAYYEFYYTTSKYSQGVTRINWTFNSKGVTGTSKTARTTNVTLKASMGSGSLYSGSLPSVTGSGVRSFKTTTDSSYGGYTRITASGTFYVSHNTSGAASVGISITGYIYNNVTKANVTLNNSGTISLTGNPPYTNCTAPTSVSVSPAIAKPGQTVTVSWSGAAAGVSNPITGYYVRASQNAYPSAGGTWVYNKLVTTSAGSGSTTFTVPTTLARGSKIMFEVQTRSSYNTTTLAASAGGSYTINSLPAAPTVTSDKTTVPSTGGDVTFTVTAGADGNGQARTLYYAESLDGAKTLFTSPLTWNITETKNFYFYTYDGLEFSSSFEARTITVNTKPTLKTFNMSAIDFTYNEETYKELFNIELDGSKLGGTYYINLRNIDDNTTFSVLKSSTTKSITNYEVLSKQGFKPGTRYRFEVYFNDGVENTSTSYSPEYITPTTYTEELNSFNAHSDTDFPNTNGHFNQRLRVYLPYDSFLNDPTQITATYKTGTESASAVSTITYNNGIDAPYALSETYCDILVPLNLTGGAKYDFTVTVGKNGLTRSYTFSKNRTRYFSGGAISGFGTSIKPFTSEISLELSIPSPISFITDTSYNFFDYNLGNTIDEPNYGAMTLKFAHSNKTEILTIDGSDSTSKFKILPPTSDDTIRFVLSSETWYELAKNLGVLDNLNNTSLIVTLTVKNLFGTESFYSGNLVFDMKENSSISNLQTKLGEELLSSESIFIREGQTFNWSYNITTFNKQKVNVKIFINRAETNTTPSIDSENWVQYAQHDWEITGERDPNTRQITQTGNLSFVIPQLTTSKYIFFKAVLTDIYTNETSSVPFAAGASNKHTSPTINLLDYSFEDGEEGGQGDIVIRYELVDSGAGRIDSNNLNLQLEDSILIEKTNEEEEGTFVEQVGTILNPTSGAVGTIVGKIEDFNQSAIHLRLRLKTRLALDADNSSFDKEIETAEFIIYNINSTMYIMYQHLGINSKNFSPETLAVIAAGAKGVREEIIFESNQLGRSISFNVNTGEVNDIIIDGGEW